MTWGIEIGDLLWNGRVALHTLNQLNQLNKWVRDFQNSKWYVSSRNVMCVNDNLVTWFSVIFIQCREFLFEEIISKIWYLEYKMLQTKVPFTIFKETYTIKIKSSKQTLLFTTIYSFFWGWFYMNCVLFGFSILQDSKRRDRTVWERREGVWVWPLRCSQGNGSHKFIYCFKVRLTKSVKSHLNRTKWESSPV